jgi:hypothetical protein
MASRSPTGPVTEMLSSTSSIGSATIAALRRSRTTEKASYRLHRRLQFRAKIEDAQGPRTLRVHLQTMDFGAGSIHHGFNPSNAGTKHLTLRLKNRSPVSARRSWVKRFDIDDWTCRFRVRFIAEYACPSVKKPVFALFNMVGVHVELLRQSRQRLLTSDRGERQPGLESRAVITTRSSRHGLPCSPHLSRSQAKIPFIPAAQFSRASFPLT